MAKEIHKEIELITSYLTTEEKTSLVASLGPYTVASITPVVVDPDFIYLFLTSSFKFNSLITTKTNAVLYLKEYFGIQI